MKKKIRIGKDYMFCEHEGNKYIHAYRKPHLIHSLEAFFAAEYISQRDKDEARQAVNS